MGFLPRCDLRAAAGILRRNEAGEVKLWGFIVIAASTVKRRSSTCGRKQLYQQLLVSPWCWARAQCSARTLKSGPPGKALKSGARRKALESGTPKANVASYPRKTSNLSPKPRVAGWQKWSLVNWQSKKPPTRAFGA